MSEETNIYPDSYEDFLNEYMFRDIYHIYTNGGRLISVYKVKECLCHYFKENIEVNNSSFGE